MNINLKKIICILLVQAIIVPYFMSSTIKPVYADSGTGEVIIGSTWEMGTVIASDEKMKWYVLDVDEDNPYRALLLTKNIIDFREFSDEPSNYRNSKIRYYLNKEFYEKNFTEEERNHIVEVEIESTTNLTDNNVFKKNVVKTNDKVFLLSDHEVEKYNISSMKFEPNSYVKKLAGEISASECWTRDTYSNLEYTRCVSGNLTSKVRQTEYSGVLVCMWYDFLQSDEILQDFDEKLVEERSGGKKHEIRFDRDEANQAVRFNTKTNLYGKGFNSLIFGQYTSDGKETGLKWYITEYDGENITLISDKILEYLEIDYDIYDKDKLNIDPYNYSNIKYYLNQKLVDKIFNEEQKNILVKLSDDEYMSIPSFDEVYKWDLTNELSRKNILINSSVNETYGIALTRYFLKEFFINDGLPYPLSLNLNEKGTNSIDYKNENYKNNPDRYFNICSGIRPIIKLNVKKLKNYSKEELTFLDEISNIVPFRTKVKFGKYEQDGDASNGREDIEWSVIKKRGSYYLLFADKILDVLDLSSEVSISNYSDSLLYSYSNYDFLNEAFSEEERKMLNVVETKSLVGEYIQRFIDGRLSTVDYSMVSTEYNKVLSLNLSLGIEYFNYMYDDIMKTETTTYVKNKYVGVNSYLKQDISKYGFSELDKSIGYMQVGVDGKYLTNKQELAGFRPIICLKEDDLLKIINNN